MLLQSIPKARIYGLEGNAEFDVTDNFKIRAGATWLDAKYGAGALYRGTAVNPVASPVVPNPSDPLKSFPNVFFPPAGKTSRACRWSARPISPVHRL